MIFPAGRIAAATESALNAVFGGSERGVVDELCFLIEEGALADAYGWPEIVHAEREYPVPRGRIDLMLFHVDGSATVIECKASRSARDVLPAIGQVMSYGVQVGYSRTRKYVRSAIASRASGAALRPLQPLFKRCGIDPTLSGA